MGLLNRKRRKTDTNIDHLAESVAYENISEDKKLSDLVLVYDEKSIILFERPRTRASIRKV